MKSFSLRKRSITLVGVSFAFFSFLSVKILLSEVSTHAATQTASQTVGPNTISMSNDDSVAITITPTSEQTIYTGTNTLSVTNSCPSGATITLTTASNSDTTIANKLVRSGSDNLTKEINPTTGSSLVNNSWGYSINGGTNYYAVPAKNESPATIYDSSSATSGADTVNVKYGIKMNHDLPSGNYSNDVVYTVAVKPACLSYTLKWDLDGGTGKTGTDYSDAQISYGENINLTNYTPTRDGYTFNGWSNGSSSFTGNETSVNVNTENTRTVTLKAKWEQTVSDYAYTGSIKSFTAPANGYYKLEVWGASGGYANYWFNGTDHYDYSQSFGGYSYGNVYLNKNQTLYIVVGGKGRSYTGITHDSSYCGSGPYSDFSNIIPGGYNGGGGVYARADGKIVTGTGGGATHIGYTNALLSATNKSNVLIVAGGGGGGGTVPVNGLMTGVISGHAGGYQGGSGYPGIHGLDMNNISSSDLANAVVYSTYGTGGTQTAGGVPYSASSSIKASAGSYGQGGMGSYRYNGSCFNYGGGGGGGLYGGGGAQGHAGGGGGGSGYLNTSALVSNTYRMYCFTTGRTGCPTNSSYYTYGTQAAGSHIENQANDGDGYARITYLGTSI